MNGRVTLISQSEYARRRGVAKSAVAKAVAEGRISLIDGKVDPAVADIQWEQNTRARADSRRGATNAALLEVQVPSTPNAAPEGPESRPAATAPASEGGYTDFRTRREKAEAERAEMETARMAGRLVDRDGVEHAVFDAFRQLRDATFSAPARTAPKLVGLSDAREIERVIAEELRKAFDGWEARMLERLPAKEGP